MQEAIRRLRGAFSRRVQNFRYRAIARLDKVMRAAADRLDFEEAAGHRDRIRYLETKGVLA